MLIEIKNRFTDAVIFSHDCEDNSMKITVLWAISQNANLSNADLSDANLSNANLSDANLRRANLSVIKNDFFLVLLSGIKEIPFLKQAIIDGKIDGTCYDGDCCCLNGTLEKSCRIEGRISDKVLSVRDSARPIERFFYRISPGHTPENSTDCKLVMDWIEEFEGLLV